MQLPDAASLQRTDAVCRKVEEILGADQGRAVLQHGRRLQPALLRLGDVQRLLLRLARRRGSEREGAGLTAKELSTELNGALPRPDPGGDGRSPSCRRPSPASAPRAASRSGCRTAAAARSTSSNQNVADASSTRRASGPSSQNVNSTFRAAVPQLFVDVDRDKALKQGVPIGDVYQTLQAFLGGAYVNHFNRFGRQWRVFLQAEGEERATPRGHRPVLRAQRRRRDGAALGARHDPQHRRARSTRSASTSTAPPRSPARRRPATARARRWPRWRRWRRRRCRARWATTGPTSRTRRRRRRAPRAGSSRSSLVFVFLILAALYESWSLPFSVLLSVPVGDLRRLRRAAARASSTSTSTGRSASSC